MPFTRTRLASLAAASTLAATTALALTTPAHATTSADTQAAPTCAADTVCTWSGQNFQGARVDYSVDLATVGCKVSVTPGFQSMIIGGAPVTLDASAYVATGCSIGQGFTFPPTPPWSADNWK